MSNVPNVVPQGIPLGVSYDVPPYNIAPRIPPNYYQGVPYAAQQHGPYNVHLNELYLMPQAADPQTLRHQIFEVMQEQLGQ
ncbi:hypothetical protein Dimus_015565, partial [Dionaea muscipula]